jgi:YD repeat-containing protein
VTATPWLAQIGDRNGNTITFDRAADGAPRSLVHSAGYHLELTLEDGRLTGLELDLPASHEETLRTAGRKATQPSRTSGYTDGNFTTVTKPSGATLTFEYDNRRRVTAWTDSNNSRYSYAYDDQDRVAAEGGEAGHFQLTLAYGEPDPSTGHRTTTLTTADGRSTRHLVDGRCQVVATTDPLGNTIRNTFDANGKQLTHTDALGRTTTFAYDEEGRVSGITQADGTQARLTRPVGARDRGRGAGRLTPPAGVRRPRQPHGGHRTRRQHHPLHL